MPEINEQILAEVKQLKSWLYGADGHEGDIPELKKSYKEVNDCLADHTRKIIRLEERLQPLPNKAKIGITGGFFTVLGTLFYLIGAKLGLW